MGLHAGAAVTHPARGPGRVLRVLAGGRRVLVKLDEDDLPRVFSVDSLAVSAPATAPAPAPRSAPPAALAHATARQALEALRLGVVPAAGLRELTVGREAELARIDRLLAGDGTGMLTIEGHYGCGKSHLIALAGAAAARAGWVVARASFDPAEVPPSHPLRIDRALMRGLQVPGAPVRGLTPLLDAALDREDLPPHRFLDAGRFVRGLLREGPQGATDDAEAAARALLHDDVMDLVHGRAAGAAGPLAERLVRAGHTGPRLLGLPDYRTFGQILAHLLTGIGAWSQALGHRGLLVLLDEAEVLHRLGPTAHGLAQNVLRHLAVAALPDTALAFDAAALPRGGHAVHRGLAPRATGVPALALIAAFTPDPDVDAAVRGILGDAGPRASGPRIALRPVRGSELPALAQRVLALVEAAHPTLSATATPEDRRRAGSLLARAFASGSVDSARQAARLVVAFWDLYRVDPVRARAALP